MRLVAVILVMSCAVGACFSSSKSDPSSYEGITWPGTKVGSGGPSSGSIRGQRGLEQRGQQFHQWAGAEHRQRWCSVLDDGWPGGRGWACTPQRPAEWAALGEQRELVGGQRIRQQLGRSGCLLDPGQLQRDGRLHVGAVTGGLWARRRRWTAGLLLAVRRHGIPDRVRRDRRRWNVLVSRSVPRLQPIPARDWGDDLLLPLRLILRH